MHHSTIFFIFPYHQPEKQINNINPFGHIDPLKRESINRSFYKYVIRFITAGKSFICRLNCIKFNYIFLRT